MAWAGAERAPTLSSETSPQPHVPPPHSGTQRSANRGLASLGLGHHQVYVKNWGKGTGECGLCNASGEIQFCGPEM